MFPSSSEKMRLTELREAYRKRIWAVLRTAPEDSNTDGAHDQPASQGLGTAIERHDMSSVNQIRRRVVALVE